ncbi:MAG: tRNA 4-thiouridine(8) synthase ThiI, partial [Mariprofundus sp.]|nr:tRNA 4-thiouridine(8) synthase ThiI [Mariprofundus sp.]
MAKILFHFGELSLKGKNRSTFERKMAQNIKRVLKPGLKPNGFYREHGRMTADVEEINDELLDLLALLPGIRN